MQSAAAWTDCVVYYELPVRLRVRVIISDTYISGWRVAYPNVLRPLFKAPKFATIVTICRCIFFLSYANFLLITRPRHSHHAILMYFLFPTSKKLNRRSANGAVSGYPRSMMELKLRCNLLLDRASGVYILLIYRLLQSLPESSWPKSVSVLSYFSALFFTDIVYISLVCLQTNKNCRFIFPSRKVVNSFIGYPRIWLTIRLASQLHRNQITCPPVTLVLDGSSL